MSGAAILGGKIVAGTGLAAAAAAAPEIVTVVVVAGVAYVGVRAAVGLAVGLAKLAGKGIDWLVDKISQDDRSRGRDRNANSGTGQSTTNSSQSQPPNQPPNRPPRERSTSNANRLTKVKVKKQISSGICQVEIARRQSIEVTAAFMAIPDQLQPQMTQMVTADAHRSMAVFNDENRGLLHIATNHGPEFQSLGLRLDGSNTTGEVIPVDAGGQRQFGWQIRDVNGNDQILMIVFSDRIAYEFDGRGPFSGTFREIITAFLIVDPGKYEFQK
ncbi:unnamed protein product [Didymodactylos carnosus]|uniref:Uncharacterized protein n=1 Tax=Didymodactylos carnosus TaxID=1234261 RepID=A0A814SGW8_9BILA|nr:unnamed protein product [Didymodactylos carnosus]CAF1147276.1 unnamed protein product [Didymodactylos carnosus]CAF3778916.1 unnamed protein product [Didymodactylos carnosus]CAF3910899.1 unnamed protein product [Didymodactylos carnosus]